MRCIDQNRTYSVGRTWQHRSHCSNVPVLCQTTHIFLRLSLCSQWNLYDLPRPPNPHKQFCLNSSLSVLPIWILSIPYTHLLSLSAVFIPTSSPRAPFSPLPQTCTHKVSSNLALCPWVHTVTKANCSLLFGHCILSLKPLSATFPVKKKRCKFQALGTKGYYNIPMGCVAITRLITSLLQNIPVFQLRYSTALCKRCSESCAAIPLCRHCSAALSPSSASSLISRVTVKQACGNFVGARPDANSNTSCHQYCSATDQILPPPPPTLPTQALMKTNLLHVPIVFIRRKSFILNVLQVIYQKNISESFCPHLFMHLLQKICFVFVLYIFCKYV